MAADWAVLDAWAALAFLQGEQPAADRVLQALESDGTAMCWVNLGEVAYIVERRHGRGAADDAIDDLRARLGATVDADAQLTREAARIKVAGGMSYADAFAAATASARDAVLLTGDPELLTSGMSWRAEDLRRA